MKRAIFLVALAGLALGPACKKAEKESNSAEATPTTQQPAASKPVAGHPGPGHGAPDTAAPANGMAGKGTVSETMDSGGYTYVKLDGPQGQVWAAAPVTPVKVGDEVSFSGGMPMEQFRSNTLGRTFDIVYFVPGLTINGALPKAPSNPGAAAAQGEGAAPAAVDKISKAEGGKTVAEVFAGKAELSGKEVLLRGKVVKFNAGIMGRNWIHIQDGSGSAGTNDLTVTTAGTAVLGQTVLIKGTVGLDKDFGAGYKYGVIVEDATVSVE